MPPLAHRVCGGARRRTPRASLPARPTGGGGSCSRALDPVARHDRARTARAGRPGLRPPALTADVPRGDSTTHAYNRPMPWPEPVERVAAFLRAGGAESRLEQFPVPAATAQEAAD